MKTQSTLLHNFIKDFDLEDIDHSVCFTANIEFSATGIYFKTDTEIHLVTIQSSGISILYLLDPDIFTQRIPDAIPYSFQHFIYTEKKFLSVNGISQHYGSYTLNIYPQEKICYANKECRHGT